MIPHPEFKSHLFTRVELTSQSQQDRLARYRRQPRIIQAFDYIASRLIVLLKMRKENRIWVLFRMITAGFRGYFKIFHRLDIQGYENIPDSGCIFITNHPGSLDPLVIMGAVKRPIGMFTSFGDGWLSDVFEKYIGYIKHQGTKDEMLEHMIRLILCENRYLLIAPEGLENQPPLVQEGFSGIVNVYSVLNYDKNRIPIVPIIMQNSQCYHGSAKMNTKKLPKIRISFLPAYFLPRDWLKPIDQGGKKPREIINWIMLGLAHKLGQKNLALNNSLESSRKRTP